MKNAKIGSAEYHKQLENVGDEANWKNYPSARFYSDIIEPAHNMSDTRLARVISALSDKSFNGFMKKLWTEQDINPMDDDGDGISYERSKPIMKVLQRCLAYRYEAETNLTKKTHIQQQLALISMILDPSFVAKASGKPLSK